MHPQFLANIRSNALGPLARVHIDLSNCFLSPRELEQFAISINKNIAKNVDILCPIQTINLSGNEICAVDASGEGEFEYRGLKAFTNCCVQRQKQLKLKRLNISRNQLGRRGIQYIASIMVGNQALTELIMRDCGLDHSNIDLLAEAIDKAKSLVVLDISLNISLCPDGGRLLAHHLIHLKRLKQLDLSGCKLGPDGMKYVCDGLCRCSSVSVLSLSNNECRDAGALAVGHLLATNHQLTHLDLQANKISSIGIKYIADGIKENKSLACLAIQWNDIDNAGVLTLAEGITGHLVNNNNNACMKAVFLFGNRMDEIHVGILAASVCYHPETAALVNATPLELDVPYIKMKAPIPPVSSASVAKGGPHDEEDEN